MEVKLKKAY